MGRERWLTGWVVSPKQNGSILDAINIWKRNIDKLFEGVEECPICYLAVHQTTKQLPKMVRHLSLYTDTYHIQHTLCTPVNASVSSQRFSCWPRRITSRAR